ncbi:universal stress protein [Halopelagius longus]|uniref:Universal stress protein n=1 Tax=Halopelagius longus TaxID=1236180 RepID=A0A1H1GA74_9EURY|nr:universal stress protein [Halopelagius longus]RDI69763.1 universal stress protein [Halopelagius longus]SDR09818.1 Nucleotide-binding universal stress protein, UspA family [Halopelagius longus]
MKDALVVLDDRYDCAELLREAAAYAGGANAELVLYSPLTESEYESARDALDKIGEVENTAYTDDNAVGVARQFADELAAEALDGFDVEWSVVADVTEEVEADRVIEVAEERDCDHVFVLGNRRTPTGKAVFGDTTQRLVLNFPGYVTVKTD